MDKKENTDNTNKRKRGRPNEKSGIDQGAILNKALKEFSKQGSGIHQKSI